MNVNEIEQLLPGVFQRTLADHTPLAAFLGAMEGLHAPVEHALAGLHTLLDPRQAPDRFVPMLARWVDMDRVMRPAFRGREPPLRQAMPSGLGRLRELIAIAARLSHWRGTAFGLKLFLETASGATGFDVDASTAGPDGQPRPFHVRVTAPATTRPLEDMLRRIIASEKPAHVTYELFFAAPVAAPLS